MPSAPGPSFDPLSSKETPTTSVKIVAAKTELLVTSSNEAHYHSVTFTGLPLSTYTLYVRRSAVPTGGAEQVDFPWASAAVDLVSNATVNLGPLLA